jgi:transposase InsO family protein
MLNDCLPLRALLLTVVGWASREQQRTIEYLMEENRVLKEQLGNRRLRLTNDQRRRLAEKGKQLGRQLLARVATIVTPDTIMRWHRQLIAAKWTYSSRSTRRQGVMAEIRTLVVRLARENPSWGYSRIQGAIGDLGHRVGRTTVSRILKREGIKPAPDRPSSWSAFIKATWGDCAAADFFTTEVWTAKGLTTFHTLFVIDLATRRVCIAGTTRTPNEAFMAQVARNLMDAVDGFLMAHRKLIVDRDTKFTQGFQALLASGGVEAIFTPPSSPNCNAYAERFVRSIKEECLGRMIFFGEASLRRALREYMTHYNAECPHQGLENRVLDRPAEPRSTSLRLVTCHERLGGLLRHYRAAA